MSALPRRFAMDYAALLSIALRALLRDKIRSLLTVLGTMRE